MAGKKKNKEDRVLVAEFRVSMHCNACERNVAKVISKIKGVETFMTDMPNHKVVVEGKINPQKILKKLKKKTGKKAELLAIKDPNKEKIEADLAAEDISRKFTESWLVEYYGDSEAHMLFNDENANACSIM